ncbi:MAG: hypothetical protein NTU61_01930, partial [Candidatus Altiarchaeota archaeon]|nr:hypothetical protein [Candidatus Altiarchaeota archaeon]
VQVASTELRDSSAPNAAEPVAKALEYGVQETASAAHSIPYFELAFVLLFAVAVGVCIGCILRKKTVII